MKKSKFLFPTTLLIGFLLLTTSCKKEKLDREKFLGKYSAIETCEQGNDETYTLTISESDASEDAIQIENLWSFNESMTATVRMRSIIIPDQKVDGLDFSGTGFIDEGEITIYFEITNGSSFDNCTSICTPK